MAKRYYVTHMVHNNAAGRCVKPCDNSYIGVADEGHIYAESEDLSNENGIFTVDVFHNIDDALKFAYEQSDFRCVSYADSFKKEDREHASAYINSHPEVFGTKKSDDSSLFKYYDQKSDYKTMSEISAACDANGLDVDVTKAPFYENYVTYRNVLDKDVAARFDDLFRGQAYLQSKNSIRFSDDRMNSILKLRDPDVIDYAIDDLYKDTYAIYNAKYVSVRDVSIQNVEKDNNGNYYATAYYNDTEYVVPLKEEGSHPRQVADEIVNILNTDARKRLRVSKSATIESATFDDVLEDMREASGLSYDDEFGGDIL